MTTVRNTPDGVVPEVPRRSDGTLYRFELIFDAGRYRAYADTLTELCEQLIAGYDGLEGDVAQAAARIAYAVRAQVHLQAAMVAEAGLASCTGEERELLLGPRHVPPAPSRWEAEVPLVLVDTYYQPLGEIPRPHSHPRSGGVPGSNLVWLCPADEASLVGSLAAAGVVVVSELD